MNIHTNTFIDWSNLTDLQYNLLYSSYCNQCTDLEEKDSYRQAVTEKLIKTKTTVKSEPSYLSEACVKRKFNFYIFTENSYNF